MDRYECCIRVNVWKLRYEYYYRYNPKLDFTLYHTAPISENIQTYWSGLNIFQKYIYAFKLKLALKK